MNSGIVVEVTTSPGFFSVKTTFFQMNNALQFWKEYLSIFKINKKLRIDLGNKEIIILYKSYLFYIVLFPDPIQNFFS